MKKKYLSFILLAWGTQSIHGELPAYGTHMPVLATVLAYTDGPVLEMGSGDFSTPLLHGMCSASKRILHTCDTDRKWLGFFKYLENEWHKLFYVRVYDNDWDLNPKPHMWDAIGKDMHWSVVFIDHRPGERRVGDVQRLRNNTDIFVVHDTENAGYGYEPTLSSFKYKYVYKVYGTETTVVSDTINVNEFFDFKSPR